MIALHTMLNTRTHRDLELIARAHKLPFTRREPKAVGLAALSALLMEGAYLRAMTQLEEAHLDALRALVAAGGWLPLAQFTAHFGAIRPYKLWREDRGPRHPWRYPASVAERLYHLGYIVIHDGEMVGIVAQVAANLPGKAALETSDPPTQISGRRVDLLRDLAALLGVLLGLDVTPVHGRWLSLTTMRIINQRLLYKEDLRVVRSELGAGRIRWLHYLAQVGGLLSVQAGLLKPTAAAWAWLDAPSQHQWDSLMQAVERDLDQAGERAWDVYRFPAIHPVTWRVLRLLLDDLSMARGYRVRDLLGLLKPYLLPDSRYAIACLLRDQFTWGGALVRGRGRVFVLPDGFDRPNRAVSLLRADECLRLPLPDTPCPAFVTLLSFAPVTNGHAVIDEAALREAIRLGLTASDVIHTLNALLTDPLSPTDAAQIQAWGGAAGQLTLKPMLVLHTPDPTTLQSIRADWRLAGHFAERLSPQHLAVVAEDASKLLHRLARRDITVTSFLRPQPTRRITDTLNSDMAEYLLLAVRAYQRLYSRLDAKVRIPKALAHWLSAQVDDPALIEASVDVMVGAVGKQVPAPPGDTGVQDDAGIRWRLAAAKRRGVPITIDYHTPYGDGHSTRSIEIEEIYESNAYTYVDAYCHKAGKSLTFRLDRIQRVHDALPTHELAV